MSMTQDQATKLAFSLLQGALVLAPGVIEHINAIREQDNKTDEQILVDMGVTLDRAEAKGLALLARVLADTQTPVIAESQPE